MLENETRTLSYATRKLHPEGQGFQICLCGKIGYILLHGKYMGIYPLPTTPFVFLNNFLMYA
jgi:hypothetical protein